MPTWKLEAGNEWVARDPFGEIKAADRSERPVSVCDDHGVVLRAARNGYASVRLWVSGKGEYRLAAEVSGPLEVDLFNAWYHRMAGEEGPRYYVDALIPVEKGAVCQLPDPDNAIDGQTHQEFWVDVFVPRDAPVGAATGRITLNDIELPLRVEVLEPVIPDDDAVIMNRHSYGCRWVHDQYPSIFSGIDEPDERWARTIELLHHIYRLVYEHRGLLTNRGVGHANTFDLIYGPTLEGRGRGGMERAVVVWKRPWWDGNDRRKMSAGGAHEKGRRPAGPSPLLPHPRCRMPLFSLRRPSRPGAAIRRFARLPTCRAARLRRATSPTS